MDTPAKFLLDLEGTLVKAEISALTPAINAAIDFFSEELVAMIAAKYGPLAVFANPAIKSAAGAAKAEIAMLEGQLAAHFPAPV